MNERIRELEKKSVFYNEDEGIWETDLKKFAELIIRECAQFCEDKNSKLLGTMMKEHFGVAE